MRTSKRSQVKGSAAMRRVILSSRKIITFIVAVAIAAVAVAQHYEGSGQGNADGLAAVEAVVERVADGDTIDVKPAAGGETMRIRLIGIDAPESVNPDKSKNAEDVARQALG